MKPFLRTLLSSLLLSLVLLLSACEDPFDRMQGEPGEDGVVSTAVEENGTGVTEPDTAGGATGSGDTNSEAPTHEAGTEAEH